MLKKLLVFSIIFLSVTSLRPQFTGPISGPDKEVNTTPGINRSDLVTFAKQYLGTTYLRGSMNPKKGFDCSGFVRFVYNNFNINVPRSSVEYKSLGKALKPEDFKVGDVLVFYGFKDSSHIGHVGIICKADGMKSKFIHSSSGIAYGVTISDLDQEMYHKRFYKCIDVIK
jgi:cell wall-associated NlpC family hydrolase